MSTLNWVVSPHPKTTDAESVTDYTKNPYVAVQFVDVIPDHCNLATDRTPWEAQTLAETLNAFVADDTETYSDSLNCSESTVKEIHAAIEWLEYWSSHDKCIYASY